MCNCRKILYIGVFEAVLFVAYSVGEINIGEELVLSKKMMLRIVLHYHISLQAILKPETGRQLL